MGKGNIRLYNTEAEYLLEKDSFELPNVSLINDTKTVLYQPFIKNDYLKLRYNVTSTSKATPLISGSQLTNLEEIIIDGNSISPVKEYTFATTGEHDIWFKFNTDSLLGPAFGNYQHIIELVEIPTELIQIRGAFGNCSELKRINLITPNGKLKNIRSGAFSDCPYITELIIPNYVEEIEGVAFAGCNIERLILPSSMKVIKAGNWNENTNLREVIIPEGVETIAGGAFHICTGLKNIVFPTSIKELNPGSFYKSGLNSITFLSKTSPIIPAGAFAEVAPNGTLYVPYGCTEAYSYVLSMEDGYLGAQGWTIQELPQE